MARCPLTMATALLILLAAGCSRNGNPQPQSDEDIVRSCIEGWLGEQKLAKNGEQYWDEYATTPIDAPNLSESARALVELNLHLAQMEVLQGNDAHVPRTVCEVPNLHAVRSWDILSIEIKPFSEKQKQMNAREARADAKVLVESSRLDGTPISQVWSIGLFNNAGKWGIHSVTEVN